MSLQGSGKHRVLDVDIAFARVAVTAAWTELCHATRTGTTSHLGNALAACLTADQMVLTTSLLLPERCS